MLFHIPRVDRPSGMLSAHDIDYLRDEHDLSGQDDRQKRYRLRRRIRAGIVDYSLLLASEHFTIEDFRLMFARKGDIVEDTEFHYGIEDTLTVLYLGCRLNQLDFEDFLSSAVENVEQVMHSDHVRVSTTFDVDVETSTVIDYEETRRRLERGEPVSTEEIGNLVLLKDLTEEDIQRIQDYSEKRGERIAELGTAEPGEPTEGDLIESGARFRWIGERGLARDLSDAETSRSDSGDSK